MKIDDVRKNAFAMPLNNPSYPRPPYKFYNREFVVITYRTDPEILRALVPEPLEVVGDTVHVVGALTSGLANERVLVDRVEVRKGPGPFETTVTLKPDQTYIDLTIEGPSNVISTGITVKRAP